MSKHTPGPWVADVENAWPEQVGCCPLVGRPYSISHESVNVAAATTPANASLIAAAPDLLEALRRVMRHIPADAGGASLSDDMHRARKAIAKAEAA